MKVILYLLFHLDRCPANAQSGTNALKATPTNSAIRKYLFVVKGQLIVDGFDVCRDQTSWNGLIAYQVVLHLKSSQAEDLLKQTLHRKTRSCRVHNVPNDRLSV